MRFISPVCIIWLLVFSSAPAAAADDAVAKAMKLLEKRHYEEAASVLRAEYGSLGQTKQGPANLTLGTIYLKNAVLHRELYQAAAASSQEYFKKLAAAQGPNRSRFADFFLGNLQLETGKPAGAAVSLEKFAGSEGVEQHYRTLARVLLGLCYAENGDAARGQAVWDGIDAQDPEVKSELAAAYSRAGLSDKMPLQLADEAAAAVKRSGKPLPLRMVRNVLVVYARSRVTERALELLARSDLKAFSYRENLGRTKSINFYDASLLGDMATVYGNAAVAYLEKASQDPGVKDAAQFYLAQAHSLFGNSDQAARMAAAAAASSRIPQQLRDRLRVWQAANGYRKDQAGAMNVWDGLSARQPEDPDLLAEILLTCARLRSDCGKTVQRSLAVAETGEGGKLSGLNTGLGKYYLGRLDYPRAAAYLEAGRDKGNKNKIEANDPVLLVGLADAYFRTKKFSEALEIFFEMSKQFPQVRQIQEAMQGVYAMEHKSAGDVKIN